MPRLFGFEPVDLPGPKPFPLVGVPQRLFRFLDDPAGVLLSLRPLGDLVGVIGGNPAIVAAFGPENVREILANPGRFRNDEAVFVGPPGSRLDKLRNAIIAVNGEVHQRHRRLMQPAFHRSAMQGYAEELTAVAEGMLARWPLNQPIRMDGLTRELALCVAVRCFYGMDVLAGATELGQLAAELVETLTDPYTILTPFNVPGLPYNRAVRTADVFLGKLEQLIEEKRREGPGATDALSMLIHGETEGGVRLNDDELLAESSTLFIAGHETIAMTLAWTLLLLEQHPTELARVVAEIDSTVGDRPPRTEDFPRMPVMDRVIRESMRILPPVPTLFMRVCAEDVRLGGHPLPKDANLVVSPLIEHHDARIYPEPRRFRPDRWIDFSPPAFTYLPYGGGPRVCAGAAFANQALRILLPMILRRFRFQLQDDAEVSRLVRANIFLARKGIPGVLERTAGPARAPGRMRGDVRELVDVGA